MGTHIFNPHLFIEREQSVTDWSYEVSETTKELSKSLPNNLKQKSNSIPKSPHRRVKMKHQRKLCGHSLVFSRKGRTQKLGI